MKKLTPKQRQFLKAEAHHLKASVHIGKGGVTPALLAELETMVESLELMKIKVNANAGEDEKALVATLVQGVDGLAHVWSIGHTHLFFRPSRNKATGYPLD